MAVTKDVTAAIRALAAQISTAKEDAVPQLLLRLKDTLHRSRPDSRERREGAYRMLWQEDLVHVMVGVTRRDFSRVSGGWETAAQLAELLATVCSGLRPQEPHPRRKKEESHLKKKNKKSDVETDKDDQVRDFYQKLLPAAVDSLLILANSLLDRGAASEGCTRHNSSLLSRFQSVLISLSRLCFSHRECVFRAVQSPLTLNLIASNQPQFGLAVVTTFNNFNNLDQQTLSSAIQSHPQTILDVLTHKITCTESESELRTECLKLLAAFIDPHSSDDLVCKLCSKHTTLATAAVTLTTSELGSRTERLVSRLERQLPPHTPPSSSPSPPPPSPPPPTGVEGKREDVTVLTESQLLPPDQSTGSGSPAQELNCTVFHREPNTSSSTGSNDIRRSAAIIIQASWRGYFTRQQLKMAEDIARLEMELEFGGTVSCEDEEETKKHMKNLSEMRTFHEKQMSLLEQLPASKVASFLQSQRTNAATVIQSWWRGKLGREEFRQKRAQARTEAAASVLQRAVRTFLRGRQLERQQFPRLPRSACFMEGCERDELQGEIVKFREQYPLPPYSKTHLRRVHDEVQQLLRDFYTRNTLQTLSQETGERRHAFLMRLEHDCDLLLTAPRLSEAGDDTGARFFSGSRVVAAMAHQMHCEEMRATELPWWKRPLLASNEELLHLLN